MERELPEIPIRITFADPDEPEVMKSDFNDESLEMIERLHDKDGPRLVQMLLLPGPISFEEVKHLPCSSTKSSSFFARLSGCWRRLRGRR